MGEAAAQDATDRHGRRDGQARRRQDEVLERVEDHVEPTREQPVEHHHVRRSVGRVVER